MNLWNTYFSMFSCACSKNNFRIIYNEVQFFKNLKYGVTLIKINYYYFVLKKKKDFLNDVASCTHSDL